VAITVFSISFSCTQKDVDKEESTKIENTLKSVSLWQDSIQVDPAKLLAYLERANEAIDSIGYPDAGYKLWLNQSDTVINFKFMINGFWPNQEVYDEIHDNELYKNSMESDEELMNNLKLTWYNRFTRVN
jgi:hypothetical protein